MRLNIEAQNGNRVFLAQHTFEPPVSSCMLKVFLYNVLSFILKRFNLVYFYLIHVHIIDSSVFQFLSRHRKEELYLHSVQISLSQMTSHSTDLGCTFSTFLFCCEIYCYKGISCNLSGSDMHYYLAKICFKIKFVEL